MISLFHRTNGAPLDKMTMDTKWKHLTFHISLLIWYDFPRSKPEAYPELFQTSKMGFLVKIANSYFSTNTYSRVNDGATRNTSFLWLCKSEWPIFWFYKTAGIFNYFPIWPINLVIPESWNLSNFKILCY